MQKLLVRSMFKVKVKYQYGVEYSRYSYVASLSKLAVPSVVGLSI